MRHDWLNTIIDSELEFIQAFTALIIELFAVGSDLVTPSVLPGHLQQVGH